MKSITQRELKSRFNRIISVADISFLFEFTERFAYNSGSFGWNFDAFDVCGVCFCKGYRTIGEKPSWTILRKYEDQAKLVYFSESDREIRKAKINDLRDLMIEELINN